MELMYLAGLFALIYNGSPLRGLKGSVYVVAHRTLAVN